MRILLDCLGPRKLLAGTATYALNLVNALAELDRQNEYVILCSDVFARQLRVGPNFTVKTLGFWNASRFLRAAWEQLALPAFVRKHRIEILHGIGHVLPLSKPAGCAFIVTIHDLTYWTHPQQHTLSRRAFMKLLLPPALRNADTIIAVSRATANDIRTRFPAVPAERIRVVPEAAHPRFRPLNKRQSAAILERAYGIGRPFILFVGTLEPRKNVPALIDAFADVTRKYPRHQLVLVGGKGWMYESIFSRVRELGLERKVRFTGYVPEDHLPCFYSAADIFVYPSLYEGFGLPVLEALACGCPVVTSRAGSIPEVAGDAAIYVSPGASPYAISQSIRALLSDARLRTALTRRGLARAKVFSWRSAARETLRVYGGVEHSAHA